MGRGCKIRGEKQGDGKMCRIRMYDIKSTKKSIKKLKENKKRWRRKKRKKK